MEDNRCALRRRVSSTVSSGLVVLAVEEDLVDFVWVVGSFRLLPGLRSVFPGSFPEYARDQQVVGMRWARDLRIAEIHVLVCFFVAEMLGGYGVFAHCFCGCVAVAGYNVPGKAALGCVVEG